MKYLLLIISLMCISSIKSQESQALDSLYCNLLEISTKNSILKEEMQALGHTCQSMMIVEDILTQSDDIMSVDFGVFDFRTTFIYDGFYFYMIKFHDEIYVYSGEYPMLIVGHLLKLQEDYPDEISIELVVEYIREIEKRGVGDMVDTLFFIIDKVGEVNYVHRLGQ